MKLKPLAAASTLLVAVPLCACGSSTTTYDIGPILGFDSCSKYDGTTQGSGFTAHCWVSKAECEKAVAAHNQMEQSLANEDGGGIELDYSCH